MRQPGCAPEHPLPGLNMQFFPGFITVKTINLFTVHQVIICGPIPGACFFYIRRPKSEAAGTKNVTPGSKISLDSRTSQMILAKNVNYSAFPLP